MTKERAALEKYHVKNGEGMTDDEKMFVVLAEVIREHYGLVEMLRMVDALPETETMYGACMALGKAFFEKK